MNNLNILTPRRVRVRGVTLVEILVVVAIMGLIAGGVGLAVFSHWQDARIRTAQTDARQIRAGVKAWCLGRGDDSCPSVRDLIEGGILDRDNTGVDVWGGEWQLDCRQGDVTVISAGPDRTKGTSDDIRIPPV